MSRALRLGIFVVAALLILGAGIFLIGRKQFLFSPTYTLKTEFDNVRGLVAGAEVRIGGMNKGTVARIELPSKPDGKVAVVMDLEGETRRILKKDSVAWIKTEGLLGNKYMEVSFGSTQAGPVKDGDTIGSEPPFEMSDMIDKTSAILDTTQVAMRSIAEMTGNLSSISAKIDQGKGTVGALINNQELYHQAAQATREAKAGAAAFEENMEALRHNFFLRGFFKKRGYQDSTELGKHEVTGLPKQDPVKQFAFDGKQIFDEPGTAKLEHEKKLNPAGQFLAQNKFGLAVVVASSGPKGDSEKERQLTQARAMVVRDYLVENFKTDDTRIKTLGLGKTDGAGENGRLEILVYPPGAQAPAVTQNQPPRSGR